MGSKPHVFGHLVKACPGVVGCCGLRPPCFWPASQPVGQTGRMRDLGGILCPVLAVVSLPVYLHCSQDTVSLCPCAGNVGVWHLCTLSLLF